jgi:hypothetical protein
MANESRRRERDQPLRIFRNNSLCAALLEHGEEEELAFSDNLSFPDLAGGQRLISSSLLTVFASSPSSVNLS